MSACPACDKPFSPGPTIRDHSVTGETFTLSVCNNCGLMKTDFPTNGTIGKYYQSEDYISHTSSAGNLVQRIYLLVRKYTLNQKLKLLGGLGAPEQSVADIGCGTGDFLKTMASGGWEISGIEPSEKARAIAERNTGTTLGKDVRTLASSFGVITLWHVLEHLEDPQETIKKLSGNLKPGGTLLIAVPNHRSWDSYHYGANWAALDVPRHLWHFTKASISGLAVKAGLKVTNTLPMKFDAYYVSMLSEGYQRGSKKTLRDLLVGIWIGFHSNLGASKTGEYSSLIYLLQK